MSISTKEDEPRSKFAAVLKNAATGPPSSAPLKRRRLPRWVVSGTVAVVAIVLVGAVLKSTLLSSTATTQSLLVEKVRRADLIVSITEDGALESAHNIDIKCELPGGGTIVSLVNDGAEVKQGDKLVEFDDSAIKDKISAQQILFEKAKATKIEAQKNFEASAIAVEEYLNGTYKQSLQTLMVTETVAKESMESAKNLLAFYNRMARNGYVTTLQRDAQAFAVERAKLDLDVAQTAITVLKDYTKRKTVVELEAVRDSNEQKMASEKAAFDHEEERLNRYQEQLEKCVVYAPDDGMVVYANEQQQRRGGNSRTNPVEIGAMMIERQTMIKLPDLTQMQVKCTVHESKIDSLKRGMRARIRIQDHEYQGVVTNVANQPEPADWFSGNVREYAATVSIESDPHGLRPV